jgi:hypothetical protein
MTGAVCYQYKGTPEEGMDVPKHVALFNFIFRKKMELSDLQDEEKSSNCY